MVGVKQNVRTKEVEGKAQQILKKDPLVSILHVALQLSIFVVHNMLYHMQKHSLFLYKVQVLQKLAAFSENKSKNL